MLFNPTFELSTEAVNPSRAHLRASKDACDTRESQSGR